MFVKFRIWSVAGFLLTLSLALLDSSVLPSPPSIGRLDSSELKALEGAPSPSGLAAISASDSLGSHHDFS